jgi:hypothetical protein
MYIRLRSFLSFPHVPEHQATTMSYWRPRSRAAGKYCSRMASNSIDSEIFLRPFLSGEVFLTFDPENPEVKKAADTAILRSRNLKRNKAYDAK